MPRRSSSRALRSARERRLSERHLLALLALLSACGEAVRDPGGDDECRASCDACPSCGASGGTTPHVGGSGGVAPNETASGGSSASASTGGSDMSEVTPGGPRPIWDPAPYLKGGALSGEPGWRDSLAPFCQTTHGRTVTSAVWADSRGVFSLGEDAHCDALSVECLESNDVPGVELRFNDGSGWQLLFATSEHLGADTLSGLASGPLVIAGIQGISFFEDDMLTLRHAAGDDLSPVARVFTTGSAALSQHGTDLLEYGAGTWTSTPTSLGRFRALWASEELVLVADDHGDSGAPRGSSDFTPLSGLPSAAHYAALWAFGPDDVWTGNAQGELLRYDGASWITLPTGLSEAVAQIWGADGVVYFRTKRHFGRYDGSHVEILLGPSESAPYDLKVESIWGLGKNEVFLSLTDQRLADYACSSRLIAWFDGKAFHQL